MSSHAPAAALMALPPPWATVPGAWISSAGQPITTTLPASRSRSAASAATAPTTPAASGPWPQAWMGTTAPGGRHGGNGVVVGHEAHGPAGAPAAQRGPECCRHARRAPLDDEADILEDRRQVRGTRMLGVCQFRVPMDERDDVPRPATCARRPPSGSAWSLSRVSHRASASAARIARPTSSATRWRLYSTEPFESATGSLASAAASPAAVSTAGSGLVASWSMNAASAVVDAHRLHADRPDGDPCVGDAPVRDLDEAADRDGRPLVEGEAKVGHPRSLPGAGAPRSPPAARPVRAPSCTGPAGNPPWAGVGGRHRGPGRAGRRLPAGTRPGRSAGRRRRGCPRACRCSGRGCWPGRVPSPRGRANLPPRRATARSRGGSTAAPIRSTPSRSSIPDSSAIGLMSTRWP